MLSSIKIPVLQSAKVPNEKAPVQSKPKKPQKDAADTGETAGALSSAETKVEEIG